MVSPATTSRRHDKYYIPTADTVFQVEDTLFRVHRYFFERESAFFQKKLLLNHPVDHGPMDSTHVIPLPNVTAYEFELFCWIFYNPVFADYNATSEQWASVLRLAHEWGFTHVKALCIRALESLKAAVDPVVKISLYFAYDVDRTLLHDDVMALVTRAAPLSNEEAVSIGLEATIGIMRIRELARASVVRVKDAELEAYVRKEIVFGLLHEGDQPPTKESSGPGHLQIASINTEKTPDATGTTFLTPTGGTNVIKVKTPTLPGTAANWSTEGLVTVDAETKPLRSRQTPSAHPLILVSALFTTAGVSSPRRSPRAS